jgi:FAD:protein FMN transferase
MNRRRFLAISAAALVPGRARARDEWHGRAFGAEAGVTLDGPPECTGPALAAVTAEIAALEALFSLHDPASALCRLNRLGQLTPEPQLQALLALCGRMHKATEGRFDPTVQPLWRALAEGRDPAPARALIGWDRVRSDATGIRLARGQALTLNGIAQGWAADRIRAQLAARGFTRALVDMGEFAALGGPWHLGLADPALGLYGRDSITGTALATSSPAALRLTATETHILGPHGEPPLWSSITVEHGSAAVADALSTAFCLADARAIRRIAAALPGLRRVIAVSLDGDVNSF